MECFDVYTKNREKTGQILERGMQVPEGCCSLIIFVCLFNKEGKMLIQQRQDTKKSWPGMWDVSVGGAVLTGETSLDAAKRETREELGAEVQFADDMPVLSIFYENSIHDIFIAEKNIPVEQFVLQEEEVKTVRWATEEEIYAMIKEGEFISVYEEFIGLLFRMRERRGIIN